MVADLRAPHGWQRSGSCCGFVLVLLGRISILARLLLTASHARRTHARLSHCSRALHCVRAASRVCAFRRLAQRRDVPPRSIACADLSARPRRLFSLAAVTPPTLAGFCSLPASAVPCFPGSLVSSSAHTGSLRTGMLVIPAALLLMAFLLPHSSRAAAQSSVTLIASIFRAKKGREATKAPPRSSRLRLSTAQI